MSPPTTETPIIDINNPKQAPIKDLILSPSDKVEIKVKPNNASQKYSVGPNFNETLASGGAKRARHITPIIPPTNEDMQLIDIAKSPSPFFANGYPSNVVATAEGVPGVLIRIADHDPPKIAPVFFFQKFIFFNEKHIRVFLNASFCFSTNPSFLLI